MAWLAIFFIIPFFSLFLTSLMAPAGESVLDGYKTAFQISNYFNAFSEYWPEFAKSLLYAASATLLALVTHWRITLRYARAGGAI
jgi:spermidine/putrescine transport system permease protein